MKKIIIICLGFLIGCTSENKSIENENYDSIIKLSEILLNQDQELLNYDFGNIFSSKIARIKLENNTGSSINLALSTSGSAFAIQRNNCQEILDSGKSCSVSVIANVRSSFDGVSLSGSLQVSSEISIGLSVLAMNGKINPGISGISNLIIEGDYPTQAKPVTNLFIKNSGNGNATIGVLAVNLTHYVVRVNQCEVGKVLEPKQECRIQLMLKRDSRIASPASAQLSLAYTDSSGLKNIGQTQSPSYPVSAFVAKIEVFQDEEVTAASCYFYRYSYVDYENDCLDNYQGFWMNNQCFSTKESGLSIEDCEAMDPASAYYHIESSVIIPGQYKGSINIVDYPQIVTDGVVFESGKYYANVVIDEEIVRSPTGFGPIFGNLINILQWGTHQMPADMTAAFTGFPGATIQASDIPKTDNVTNISYMFAYSPNLVLDLNPWCFPQLSVVPSELNIGSPGVIVPRVGSCQ